MQNFHFVVFSPVVWPQSGMCYISDCFLDRLKRMRAFTHKKWPFLQEYGIIRKMTNTRVCLSLGGFLAEKGCGSRERNHLQRRNFLLALHTFQFLQVSSFPGDKGHCLEKNRSRVEIRRRRRYPTGGALPYQDNMLAPPDNIPLRPLKSLPPAPIRSWRY